MLVDITDSFNSSISDSSPHIHILDCCANFQSGLVVWMMIYESFPVELPTLFPLFCFTLEQFFKLAREMSGAWLYSVCSDGYAYLNFLL
jgi:hypothetical protein